MINLEWYRTFKTIYDNGTLTGAAEELFMTQPGVSQQLNALENYVGKKLFERSPRKMIPTEYAKLLYIQVEESVAKLDHVENAFREHASQINPTVFIGAPHSFFFNYFTKKIHQIKCSVQVKFGTSAELLEELEAGSLHLLISTKKVEHRHIVYEELLTETMLLVASPSIDRSRFGYLVYQNKLEEAEKWLSDQTWYSYSSSMGLINKFWQRNFKKKPSIIPKYVIPDLNIITQALQFGQGISLIPDYICKEALNQDKLKAVWKGNNPTRNVLYIATNKNNPYPKELEEIKQLLIDFRRFH
jgi:DNA-binding transcriptional LysR family regulator